MENPKGLLCCFLTDRMAHKVMSTLLKLQPQDPQEGFGADVLITHWRMPSAPRIKVSSCLLSRVRGGTAGTLRIVRELAAGLRDKELLVFDETLPAGENVPDSVHVAHDIALVRQVLERHYLVLDNETVCRLEEALFGRRPIEDNPRPTQRQRQRREQEQEAAAFTDRFFEQMFAAQPRRVEAPGGGLFERLLRHQQGVIRIHMINMDGAYEEDQYDREAADEAFALAQALSFNYPQPRPPPPLVEETRTELPKTWEEIIHETSEPADQVGDPICVICDGTKKATIGFVPCGHVCACDECTRALFTRQPEGGRKCPVCNGGVTSVLRTYFSETKKQE